MEVWDEGGDNSRALALIGFTNTNRWEPVRGGG